MRSLLSLASILLVSSACSESTTPINRIGDTGVAADTGPQDTGPTAADAGPGGGAQQITIGTDDRPATLMTPRAYDGTTPLPLILVLHGYGASAALEAGYLGLPNVARSAGAYLVLADGTENPKGQRFWNAEGPCCDFGNTDVDDTSYLTGLLDDAEAAVPVDTDRIYIIGHSNGAFMGYHMACVLADRIAGVAALAGTEGTDTVCNPAHPVSVLHIHGTADATILYGGGTIGDSTYVGAEANVAAWVERNGCDTKPTAAKALNIDGVVSGDEANVEQYENCDEGSAVEFWSLDGSGHIPIPAAGATARVVNWLLLRDRNP